ncbi:MAG TPA: hypothetical protein VFX63_13900 [Pyrinomonadaceae bacterium]|nr:hypothetical protein [Pyrinomonadaceae bacterium]
MELLKMGITNPEFVNPENTTVYPEKFKDDVSLLLKYGRYAFAAWNIVETIADRHGNRDLKKTWYPVIKEENRLHRKWLNNIDNQHKFKKDFWRFMLKNHRAFPCPDCQGDSLCGRCAEIWRMVNSKEEIPVIYYSSSRKEIPHRSTRRE